MKRAAAFLAAVQWFNLLAVLCVAAAVLLSVLAAFWVPQVTVIAVVLAIAALTLAALGLRS